MPRYVLIDDDPAFCKIMHQAARRHDFELDTYHSLASMNSIGQLATYDGAIVDYDLGNMTGIEISQYLEHLFCGMPMVLISFHQRPEQAWPSTIKRFVHKSAGYQAILAAMDAVSQEVGYGGRQEV